jgi:hypothetical protein
MIIEKSTKYAGSVNSKGVSNIMKPSRIFRSFGAALVCFAMVLCNVPLVQAADITISAAPIVPHPVCGNGVGLEGDCSATLVPLLGPASDNTVTINGTATIGMTGTDDAWVYGGWATGIGENANGNEVTIGGWATINNGDGDRIVIGGVAMSGNAVSNIVTIDGSATIQNAVVGGLSVVNGTPLNNTVTINGGTIGGDVTGGRIGTDAVEGTGNIIDGNNVVYINGGTIRGSVYGSRTDSGNIYNTTDSYGVIITGGTTLGVVYDGYTTTANVEGNKVLISGGTANAITAAFTDLGNARGNKVTVAGGLITDIIAGQTTTGISSGNIVDITGGSADNIIDGFVRAGYSEGGSAQNNTVNIDFDGIVTGSIVGGYSNYGTAMNNTVTMENGEVTEIVGGYSDYGSVTGNEVIVNGGRVTRAIGGSTYNGENRNNTATVNGGAVTVVMGGRSERGNASANTVRIEGSALSNGTIAGGWSNTTGTAEGNTVVIINGRGHADGIAGGRAGGGGGGIPASGNANNNEVRILDGTVGANKAYGGESSGADYTANNNTIFVRSSGTFGEVRGGFAINGSAAENKVIIEAGGFERVHGGYSGNGYARGNTLELSGGHYTGEIIGGYSNNTSATNNTVSISGNATFGSGAVLYGGYSASGGEARSGNTLNIKQKATVRRLDNFENFNFYLPAGFRAGDTVITVTNGNRTGGAINIENAKVDIGVEKGSALAEGDTVILIDEQSGRGFSGNPVNTPDNESTIDTGSGWLNYNFSLRVDNSKLYADLSGIKIDPRTGSLPDGFMSGVLLANQGADAIAGSAMDSAMTAAHRGPVKGLGGFGSLVAGKSRYDTGSDVDMFGVSAAAGLALGVDFAKHILTLGPFLEYGKGDYDTISSIDAGTVRGDGNSEYMGGGFLLRVDYKDTGMGRYFAEASVRAGQLKNNFSITMPEADGEAWTDSYKSSSPYYGVHLGYGGSWDVAAKTSLDIYGKYFMARGNNSKVTLSEEDILDFGKLASNRVRGGTRVAVAPNDNLAVSFGGAYDYEISGESKASLLGYTIDNTPSLKGGTGIGEVIIGYKPSASSLTSINFGVQGYAGKRRGVTASMFIRF